MTTLKVGGVPEHFNLPWHLGIENQIFKNEGLAIDWVTCYGGTGEMTRLLRNNEIDVCVVLTEGIIADIINNNNQSRIISQYLNTPLIWGIFTGINNPLEFYGQIYEKKYAISRFGSGSHLMPIVDAIYKKKKIDDDQFVVIKNLDGALTSLANLETDVFYWEKYTTKPYVDKGLLKCLGEFVTPWPCFVIAASEKALKEKSVALTQMLKTIYFINKQFMTSIDAVEEVSKRYDQQIEDVDNWFHSTEWTSERTISRKMIASVNYTLRKSGIIKEEAKFEDLVNSLD